MHPKHHPTTPPPYPHPHQDVVEVQLLREVAARSTSFFQAASQLQGLRGILCDSLDVVRSLRRHVTGLDGALYSAAVGVVALQRRRGNLVATLGVTKALGDVLDCRQALEGMIESEDYAGGWMGWDGMGGWEWRMEQRQLQRHGVTHWRAHSSSIPLPARSDRPTAQTPSHATQVPWSYWIRRSAP